MSELSIFVSTGPFRLNVIASGQGALSSWRGNLPTGTHEQGGRDGEAGFYRVADQPFQARSSVVRSVGMGGVKVVDEAFQLILGWGWHLGSLGMGEASPVLPKPQNL